MEIGKGKGVGEQEREKQRNREERGREGGKEREIMSGESKREINDREPWLT